MIQSIYWIFPFIITLAMVAMGPLLWPQQWPKYHFLGFSISILSVTIPLLCYFGYEHTCAMFVHMLISEYIPFISLAGSLFIISSGIYIQFSGKATPFKNTLILLCASLFSSLIGTLGASLVFIRPFLQYNAWRHHKTHLAIFFIFSVANIAGVLTPLGDPPLFLGFLKGVDFCWTLIHLWPSFILTLGILLGVFYKIDRYFYCKETVQPTPHSTFVLQGSKNFIPLSLIVIGIFISNKIPDAVWGQILDVVVQRNMCLYPLGMIILGSIAFQTTPKKIRDHNRFSWAPLKETGVLFAAVFITLIPVNILLEHGEHGPLSALFELKGIKDKNPATYFWVCGLLSAVLDNAPTYMIFFKIAGGQANLLMTQGAGLLKAISLGAVFMGALTYIGNAPNMIIKEIAQEYGVQMPSFLGYLKYSIFLIFIFLGLTVFL